MIALSSTDIARLLPMESAISLVAGALKSAANGTATLPLRQAMDVGAGNRLGIMPGALQDPPLFGAKLISLFPENPASGYSSHLGLMVLFEADHGTPVAILDAALLTAIRTAAASAVATDALARADAQVLAIVGTGEQAAFHIESLRCVRDIRALHLVGRRPERTAEFAAQVAAQHPQLQIETFDTVRDAVAGADIVCTVTSAQDTVLEGDWIGAGTHVNAVGASIPTMREIDAALVRKSRLFVDYRPSALAQAREIIEALESGLIPPEHILGEVGALLEGRVTGRRGAQDITLFRSLGIAAEDIACAHFAVQQARLQGMGTEVPIL